MGWKTIRLSEDAYNRLNNLKRGQESFSDVVLRLAGRQDLMKFAGSITPGFADALERHSRSVREQFDRDALGPID